MTSVTLLITMVAAFTAPAASPAAAQTPPSPKPCSNAMAPPEPVDSSEVPPPGEKHPAPLPVPDPPVGGERMAECRLVLPAEAPRPPKRMTAASWILVDLDTLDVLAAKDPHARHRPASLIKVLLALAVLEELDPADVVTATKADAEQECTCIGIVKGGKYSVDDLFTSLLIRSGNDVAHTLATALGGVPAALEKMNVIAQRIGALDTRAGSPSGLDAPGMSSSAYDMALIFRHALSDPRFTKAIATTHLSMRTEKNKPPITIYNDNRLLAEYDGFFGGKTGFTNSSRHTYVGGAERDGKRIGVVLMRAEQQPRRVSEQAARLLDYGFRLAARGTEPVGELVPPITVAEGENLAEGLEPAAPEAHSVAADNATEEDDDAGGSAGALALLIAAAALLAFVALRQRKAA